MPSRTVFFKFGFLILFVWTFTNCRNEGEIPFPDETDGYTAPATVPVQFGPSQKIAWPEPASLTSVPGNFNFEKLPSIRFDSSGFAPFPKPPEESSFDWNKLPGSDFNYDSLPEIPLRFKTSVMPPPEIIKVNRPVLKNTPGEMIYDFGEPLNGDFIRSMLKTKDGFTWISAGKGLYRYDGDNLFLYTINELNADIFDMAEDKDGKIWIATGGKGLFVIDFKNGISRQLSSKEGLLSNFSVRIFADHQTGFGLHCYRIALELAKASWAARYYHRPGKEGNKIFAAFTRVVYGVTNLSYRRQSK
jgi:hypothetical protein